MTIPTLGGPSPWGSIDYLREFRRDGQLIAVSVSTPSHGGFWVAPEHRHGLAALETAFSKGGWFEEDCDWALPYLELGLGRIDDDSSRVDLTTVSYLVKFYHPKDWTARLRAEGRKSYETERNSHFEDSCPYSQPEDRQAWQAGWLDGREALFEGTMVGVIR